MRLKSKKHDVLPIGIDLGAHSLKMAQCRRLPTGQFSLLAASTAEFDPEVRADPTAYRRFTANTIGQLIGAYPFKGRRCILSLPAEMTFVQHLKMARMPQEQLADSLQWELQGKLPFDPSQAVIQHVTAGEVYVDNEMMQEVIVVAARRDIIESHLEILQRAKLECVGVNVESCAIVECFARLFRRAEDAQRATLFVDIGASSTQVVISHGARMAFAKNLMFGGDQFDEAVASTMELPLDEARRQRSLYGTDAVDADATAAMERALAGPLGGLSEELTNCLHYYDSVFADRPVERVVFLGGQAFDKNLCQALAQRLALPAQIGDPLAQIGREVEATGEDAPAAPASRPDWAVAVGLSLGATVGPDGQQAA